MPANPVLRGMKKNNSKVKPVAPVTQDDPTVLNNSYTRALRDIEQTFSSAAEFKRQMTEAAKRGWNSSAPKPATPQPVRIDLQTEQCRVYTFSTKAGLVEVVIDQPLFLVDSPNGHRIVDCHNRGHYIPKGWVHLCWVNKPGANPLVH